jgi:hypothetical protein
MILTTAFFALLAGIQGVSAHGGVISYNIAGTTYPGFMAYNTPVGQSVIQRQWAVYDPITTVSSESLSGCVRREANVRLIGFRRWIGM